MSYAIHYTGYPRVLEGYCDANWISGANDFMPQADTRSCLEVVLVPRSLASRLS
jgi:hypothetical protein